MTDRIADEQKVKELLFLTSVLLPVFRLQLPHMTLAFSHWKLMIETIEALDYPSDKATEKRLFSARCEREAKETE